MAGDASRKNGLLGGRPTKLTEKVVAIAEAYVNSYSTDDPEKLKELKLPNVARLCILCGIRKDTAYVWAKPDEGDDKKISQLRTRFSDALDKVQRLQEMVLNEDGATGKINAHFAKFLLMAKHDHAEKRELTGKDGGPIEVNEVKGFKMVQPEQDGDEE